MQNKKRKLGRIKISLRFLDANNLVRFLKIFEIEKGSKPYLFLFINLC